MTQTDREIKRPLLPAVLPPEPPQRFLSMGHSQEQWDVLTKTFYPSAKSAESIMMVVSYCAARKLDMMTKPFHIVPIWNKETQSYQDGVWPSVSLYEITAHRTGEFAGIDEPVYGPEKEFVFTHPNSKSVLWKRTLPAWCKVTVYRLVNGVKQAFTSEPIYFDEFVGIKDNQPNGQWDKRPRYMMAKCAKSAALRMAFPEETGSMPTAEEMEGQSIGEISQAQESKFRALAIASERVVDGEVIEPTHQENLQAAAEVRPQEGKRTLQKYSKNLLNKLSGSHRRIQSS